jgi:transposase-like protein
VSLALSTMGGARWVVSFLYQRNGSTPKTLMTEHGPVALDTPRDRNGSFEPKIVRKRLLTSGCTLHLREG